MSSIAHVPAVLRAPDVDAKCTLEVWQESSSTGRIFTRCRITDEIPDVPDGPYQVVFANHLVRTWKTGGAWELVFLSPEIGADLFVRSIGVAS